MTETQLPDWETGDEGLLAVLGIEGDCCVTCASDAEYGYELCWVTLPDGRDAEVCCTHVEPIKRALASLDSADSGEAGT